LPVAGEGELTEGIRLLARTHQSFVWERQGYANNCVRSAGFSPAALEYPTPYREGIAWSITQALAASHLEPWDI
jgi:hypothetical protein